MGYVSKFENDQERLYEAAACGALSFTTVPKSELEKTKLKFEIENLQKFIALVRCALGTAKIQVRELEKQNAKLKAEATKLREQFRKTEATNKTKVDSVLDEKRKQFDVLITELDKYRFSEFKRLYKEQTSQTNIATMKSDVGKTQKGTRSTKADGLQLNPVLPAGFDL